MSEMFLLTQPFFQVAQTISFNVIPTNPRGNSDKTLRDELK